MTQALFDKTIGGLYDAAADVDLWPQALASLSELLGAVGTQILFWDRRANAAAFSVCAGFSEETNRLYVEHYGAIDPKQPYYYTLPVGEVFACHSYFDQHFVDRSEFFQDFLIPADGRWCMVADVLRTPELAAMIGVHRNARMERFEGEAVALLKRLVPHLQRATQLQLRLGQIEAQRQAMAGALDRLAFGVILVGERLRAIAVNRAAEDLLRRSDGIALRQERLAAAHGADDAALQGLLRGAVLTGRRRGRSAGGALALARPSGKRPLSVLVAPLRPTAWAVFPEFGRFEPLAVVFVVDPERQPRLPGDLLRQLYGLTAREAQLAELLAAGHSVEAAAEAMAVTRESARTYLKRVLFKTGTARQAELVGLFLRSVAPSI